MHHHVRLAIHRNVERTLPIVFVLLAAACGGSTPAPTPTATTLPGATTVNTPTTTPTTSGRVSTPTPGGVASATDVPSAGPTTITAASPGYVVFLRAKQLWIAHIDGTKQRALTSGSLGAGYAGYVRSGASLDVYYAAQVDGDTSGGNFKVYRQPAEGGNESELFSFHGDRKNAEFVRDNAAVSPDGRTVVYADERGLNRHELGSGADVTLLANIACDARKPGECHGYYSPRWSPAGTWLLGTKIFFEGGLGILIQPNVPGPQETQLKYYASNWSADGTRFCGLVIGGEQYTGLVVLSSTDLTPLDIPLTNLPPEQLSVGDCAWRSDGWVAVEYRVQHHSLQNDDEHLATFDASLALVSDINLNLGKRYASAEGWLPDGTLVVSDQPPDGSSHANHIMMPDGTMRDFGVPEGEILALIP